MVVGVNVWGGVTGVGGVADEEDPGEGGGGEPTHHGVSWVPSVLGHAPPIRGSFSHYI